jgi:hypothetical protein
VLTGTGGCVPELLASAPDPSARDLGHVPPRLLAELYRRAAGLVYPSLYEGFGLPLLEAFAFGLPVVCSSTTSLPEVGGEAVLAVDPEDEFALAAALERIATDAALRAALAARGRSRLAGYDADRGAHALLVALEDVAARRVPMPQVRTGLRLVNERLAESEADRAARLSVILRQHESLQRQQELLCEQDEELSRQRGELVRLTAYERLLADSPAGPLVSVVVAMGDHRGGPARCVRAWAREQTLPRDRIEVVVAFDGKEPAELEKVRRELGPADRVIHLATDSASALWAEGARHARGRWLYFAEAHSYGEPECLEEMLRYLVAEGVPAASSRSLGAGGGPVARLEEQLFERVGALRLADGHWSKLFLRGTAVERAAYERVGGLEGEYGLFAEPLLSARLHRAGLRVGHARRSVVRHINAESFRHLAEHVGDYTRGECAFRLKHAGSGWDAYFGRPPEWDEGGRTDPALARAEARVLSRALARGGVSAAPRLAKLLPACVLGGRWWRWRAAARAATRRLRVALSRDGEERVNAFADWWEATAVGARIDFLTRLGEQSFEMNTEVGIDELPAPCLVGFHPPERLAGLPLRWSEPLAHLKLPLPPGEQVLELATRELRPALALEVSVNGRAAPFEDRTAREGAIRVTVREADRRSGLQYITLRCAPWTAPRDSRVLGLPLFGLRRVAARRARLAA